MAMDIGNSAARILVRVGADGGHPTYVRTYPCKPGAKAYPGWHAFGFPWWQPDREEAFVGPGCTSEFSKRSNKFPDAMPGLHFHGDPLWYEFGLPESAFALSGDALPVRQCNPFVALDVQDITGTTLNADFPDCSVLQFDRAGLIEVVVGHTLAQQVVRWLGCTVGEVGGSAFDGVYTIVFEGAVVAPVDARTVSVSVTGSTPSIGPLGNTSGGPPYFYALGPGYLSSLWQFSSDDYTLYLPRDGDVGPGYYFYLQRVPGSGAGGPTLLPYPGDSATVNGVDIAAGYELSADLSWALLVKLSPAGISPQEWLALPSGAGGGGGGGSLTVGTTPIVGGTTGDYLKIGGGGLLASGGLAVPLVLHATSSANELLQLFDRNNNPFVIFDDLGTISLYAGAAGGSGPNINAYDAGWRIGSGYAGFRADFSLRWTATGQPYDAKDTYAGRLAAGILAVGTTGPDGTGGLAGYLAPPSLSDAAASANALYYSTTQSKLCYKDPGGTVHQLY